MKTLPWFRMYHEAIDDEKLRLLACEDRWHFVALLCCKAKGILDDGGALLRRKVAVKLGLSTNELDEVARRLSEVDLIDKDTLQPKAWDARQMVSDLDLTAADRKRRQREREKETKTPVTDTSRVTSTNVTPTDTDTDTDKEVDKKNTSAVAPPEGVSLSVWQDFKAIRKTKKAAITETAINKIRAQAAKAGVSLQVALETCCERGWASFNADWVAKVEPKTPMQAESFRERDDRIAAQRIAEFMPGIAAKSHSRNVIDITPLGAIA